MEKYAKRQVILADLGLLLVAIFWGGGFVAGKFALEGLTPLTAVAYRYLGATIFIIPFCIVRLKNMTKKTFLAGSVIGVLIVIGTALQTIGLQYTTPGNQSFIISLYTVIVPIMSWLFLKIKPSPNVMLAAALALVGITLLTLNENLNIGMGDWLTFIFAITFSAQIVFISILVKELDPWLITFTQVTVTAVLAIIAAFLFETPSDLMTLPKIAWEGLLYLIVLNTTGAFLLQNICQKIAPANHTAIILSTETVFGTIFAIVFAGEIFTKRMITGCIFMIFAIIISELPKKQKQILK
ncbi:DMT family transporter [Aminipila sp.]|uniref:DMT family transporter n=1 Tax=Aminipila sp. TaxID=2060095 RepID=UPI00289F170A|nr:DMT family transporter [Aminipila sp.]